MDRDPDPPRPIPPRRRGRPKGSRVIREPRASVSVWLPVSTHAQLTQLADRSFDGSLSAAARHVLHRVLIIRLR